MSHASPRSWSWNDVAVRVRPACRVLSVTLGLLLAACGSKSGLPTANPDACADAGSARACFSVCGQGVETCVAGSWQGCSAPRPKQPKLAGVVRDFHASHPDMESAIGDDPGMVLALLGDDDKPVYAGTPTTSTTHGKAAFDEWYRDVPGVNLSSSFTLPLSKSGPNELAYSDGTFFPIDGQLFGNEGNPHNFHFTFEVRSQFRYQGGEVFTFTGDDDLWVFINRRLAIDLGGVHGSQSKTVVLDQSAAELGLDAGNVYPFHLFFAERHTSASSFRLETTIDEFDLCE
ncbi:MAG: fibro-slime domain-containing protein [Myxococcales bacterium]|nr:fibro-slime domain-containing protein [Myxococcales bacterium]